MASDETGCAPLFVILLVTVAIVYLAGQSDCRKSRETRMSEAMDDMLDEYWHGDETPQGWSERDWKAFKAREPMGAEEHLEQLAEEAVESR